jgi:hypothetical protein
MGRGDPTLGNLLFLLFTAISVVSIYFIGQHFHSRRLGILVALTTLLFFVALFFALEALLRWLGL